MSRLRFWQKTYLLTLALFLVALFGSTAFMGWQNQQQTFANEVEKLRGEQRFVAQNLAQDLAVLDKGAANLRAGALARSYGEHYAANGMLIDVRNGKQQAFSNLPGSAAGSAEIPLAVQSGRQTWAVREFDGTPYLLAASSLPDDQGAWTLTCARPLDALYATWSQMRVTLMASSALASIALAVVLFFILRGLVKPIEQLANTANAFAAGDFGIRAAKRSNDEVGVLADSLNAMADRAEGDIAEIQRIAESNARMAANLSHEIRTPLTAVRGYAEYLRLADPAPDERDSALASIVEQSTRLQAVSQSMLSLAALDHDEAAFASLDLDAAARRAMRAMLPAAHEAGVRVQAGSLDSAQIAGDEVLIESLVTNLLDNAVKACEPGGTVHLSIVVDTARKTATLAVADDGRGLEAEALKRLGEPFYRPDKARSRAEGGAGLGVALCVQIARMHDAKLTYESMPGIGTTATVEFTAS